MPKPVGRGVANVMLSRLWNRQLNISKGIMTLRSICRPLSVIFHRKTLNVLGNGVHIVNRLITHSWGQKVIRFYDLDGNLIEVGTPM